MKATTNSVFSFPGSAWNANLEVCLLYHGEITLFSGQSPGRHRFPGRAWEPEKTEELGFTVCAGSAIRDFCLTQESKTSYFVYEMTATEPIRRLRCLFAGESLSEGPCAAQATTCGVRFDPIQQLVLEPYGIGEGISAGDLGKKLVLDPSTLSGILDRMTERGGSSSKTTRTTRESLDLSDR